MPMRKLLSYRAAQRTVQPPGTEVIKDDDTTTARDSRRSKTQYTDVGIIGLCGIRRRRDHRNE
jgi:hypothetical protein